MRCKNCNSERVRKRGKYKTRGKYVQRFHCRDCDKTFTSRTHTKFYRKRKQALAKKMLHMYCEGMSLNAIARVLVLNRKTVSRYFIEASGRARVEHIKRLNTGQIRTSYVQFDEMESFEIGKMRPLGIELAVRVKTGEIISAVVARIPIKAYIMSKKKKLEYAAITDRKMRMSEMLLEVSKALKPNSTIESDEAFINTKVAKEILPKHRNITQPGTSKALWRVNYVCLKLRQDVSRLRRATLATTKRIDYLQKHLDLYIAYHNGYKIF